MFSRAALILLPVTALAQSPPADVEKALRDRLTEFYQYHVSGDFEKAWPMVCEDTKKAYFSGQKTKFESFHLDSIKWSDNFTKAEVTMTVEEKRRIRVQFPETVFKMPSVVYWKFENGNWCWYQNQNATWITPMGPSDVDSLKKSQAQAKGGSPALTPDLIQQRAKEILEGSSSFDKTELNLRLGQPSSDLATFRNGQGGTVKISIFPEDLPQGLTARLDKTDLNAGDTATLRVYYSPPTRDAKPPDVVLRVVMEPFGRVFPITVRFLPPR